MESNFCRKFNRKADKTMNPQLEIKNKITFLHNNLQEGNSYQINGKNYTYQGYFPAVKQGIKVHNFIGQEHRLILDREDLICLDLFNEIQP